MRLRRSSQRHSPPESGRHIPRPTWPRRRPLPLRPRRPPPPLPPRRRTYDARHRRSPGPDALGDRLEERVERAGRARSREVEVGGEVNEKGYTLVELLVVMIILSIVVAGLTTVFVTGSNAEAQLN